jgi:DNA invertase Pin-like site-specific DNA recombinase
MDQQQSKLFSLSKEISGFGTISIKGRLLKHGFGQLLEAIKLGEIREGDVILAEAIDRMDDFQKHK